MNHQLICTWLGLPAEPWPPDHYALLGLKPGEADAQLIEHHVHERLARVRGYQLSNPDQATEAMNRLAQAFLCLTDPGAKSAYDQTLPVAIAPAGTVPVAEMATDDGKKQGPVRVRGVGPAVPAEGVAPSAVPAEVALVARPVDATYDLALSSPEARRGLGTAAALLHRLMHARQLCRTWDLIGKTLERPKPPRAPERKHLSRRVQQLAELLEDFPPILGHPGQPGYRLVAMARLDLTGRMLETVDPDQREALGRDWLAGQIILKGYLKFLRHEVKAWRRQTWLGKGVRAIRAALNDHPLWVGLGATLIVIVASIFIVANLF